MAEGLRLSAGRMANMRVACLELGLVEGCPVLGVQAEVLDHGGGQQVQPALEGALHLIRDVLAAEVADDAQQRLEALAGDDDLDVLEGAEVEQRGQRVVVTLQHRLDATQ
eukprot:scaffold483574_cov19-Prasinocladus_malaysianus.AAC.1